jgi:arylsulfatase A-like enzyme
MKALASTVPIGTLLLALFLVPSHAEFALWRRKTFGTDVTSSGGAAKSIVRSEKQHHNVLHIVLSGMRPESNEAYGRKYMVTPTLDRLAKDGLTFSRVYAQIPSWSASRHSYMLGVRPDFERIWAIQDNGDETPPTALTDVFHTHGYEVMVNNETDHDENVNSVSDECAGVRKVSGAHACLVDNMEEIHEYHAANEMISKLQEVKNGDKPFYFFMTLRQPRFNRNLHKTYWDMYPDELQIPLAEHRKHFTAMQEGWTNGRSTPGTTFWPDTNMEDDHQDHELAERRARKAYYVSITQMDAQIGRVLRAVEAFGLAQNTMVVVHGDHGSQLGEHGIWEPALLEPSLRVPLFISAPWKTKSLGRVAKQIVELVDLRRTLPLLAGIKQSGAASASHDFQNVFDLPGATTKPVAISQLLGCLANKPGEKMRVLHVPGPSAAWKDCYHPTDGVGTGHEPPQLVMGYSLRVDGYRFTEWRKMDPALLVPDWAGNPLQVELYQLDDDNVNDFDLGIEKEDLAAHIATHEDYEDVSERLHELLQNNVPVEEQIHLQTEFAKLPDNLREPRPWDELLGVFFTGDSDDVFRISAGSEL